MQPTPNIVRGRLKAAIPTQPHPDANLLSAFSEKSLSDHERAAVLNHLAACTDCRDILAFALPAMDSVQPAFQPSPTRWTWPLLRWGLVTAGIALIAAFAVMRFEQHSQPSARIATAPHIENFKVAVKNPPSLSNSANSADTLINSPFSPESSSAQKNLAQLLTPRAHAHSASVSKKSRPGDTLTPQPPAQSEQAAEQPAENQLVASANDFSDRVGKSKDATSADEAASSAPDFSQLVASASGIMPRWGINSTGSLQQSFDQGATWRDVDITASAVPVGGPLGAPSPVPLAAPHAPQPVRPNFRVVAASGPDVWAGGTAGVLYHSSDNGDHWSRIDVSNSQAALTGDIVSLEVLHPTVKLITSTSELWTSSDNGQTWQKQ
ncbi:MAG TPA: YCF48-related protein [Verrucomicrobiae bacterium]|nr:YCF48-related protein [Verrucomicrobiae bacterium]